MSNLNDRRISFVGVVGPDNISSKGDSKIEFIVERLDHPTPLPGVMVGVDVDTGGRDVPDKDLPQVSADGKKWAFGAQKATGANGMAWFYVRSGNAGGSFDFVGTIDDAKAPSHRVNHVLQTSGSVSAVVFEPNPSETTWQGEVFSPTPAVIVKATPDAGQLIRVRIAGPGQSTDPADHNAGFLTGHRQDQEIKSGSTLPAVTAGKQMGAVTLTPSVGTLVGPIMTWQVIPVADRLVNMQGGQVQQVTPRDFESQLPGFRYLATGHRTQGDTSTAADQIVPIAQWSIKIELPDSGPVHFVRPDGSMVASLVIKTDEHGYVSIPPQSLRIVPAEVAGKTIAFKAYRNAKHDGSGAWLSEPGNKGELRIHFSV